MRTSIKREQYETRYAHVLEGDADWRALQIPAGDTFAWDDASTYIRKPSFFDDLGPTPKPLTDIKRRARARDPRRLGHDRSHLAGRQHREGLARRRGTSTSTA